MFVRGDASFPSNTFLRPLLRAAASFIRMWICSTRARCRTIYPHIPTGIGWKTFPANQSDYVAMRSTSPHAAPHSAGIRKPWKAGVTRCRRRLAAFICFVPTKSSGCSLKRRNTWTKHYLRPQLNDGPSAPRHWIGLNRTPNRAERFFFHPRPCHPHSPT